MARRKASDSEQLRNEVLKAAIEIFSKSGFEQASLQLVAKKSGTGHTNILYHYKSKVGLLQACIEFAKDRAIRTVTESFEPRDGAFERLEKTFLGLMTWSIVYRREAQLVVLLSYYAGVRKDFEELFDSWVKAIRGQITELLFAGRREQAFHFKGDPERLGTILYQQLFGMMNLRIAHRKLAGPPEVVQKDVRKILKKLTETEVKS